MKRHIIIISDQSGGSSNPITHELIACAKILQQLTALPLKILITGSRPDDAASRLFEKYGIDALVVRHGNPLISNDITIKIMPVSLISDLNPSFILLPHTTEGLDAAPGLAVKINAACITGVEKVTRRENAVCFTRSVFGDKIGVQMNSTANTTVLTVAPGCFKPETGPVPYDGKLEHIDIDLHTESYRLVDRQPNTADSSAITDADVIVSAGNGIREKEDLALVYNLAAAFPRSAVTGSRPICDKKWMKYNQQVGVTGITVAPKLYFACGISGSSQHIAGMRDSKFIVSINTDPHAAIFNVSDICIIDDLKTFIPTFIDAMNVRARQ